MDSISLAAIGAVIGILAALSGVVLGWMGNARANRTALIARTESDTQVKSDLKYIKEAVDSIRGVTTQQGGTLYDHERRITCVEESTKSAHKRIEEMKGR